MEEYLMCRRVIISAPTDPRIVEIEQAVDDVRFWCSISQMGPNDDERASKAERVLRRLLCLYGLPSEKTDGEALSAWLKERQLYMHSDEPWAELAERSLKELVLGRSAGSHSKAKPKGRPPKPLTGFEKQLLEVKKDNPSLSTEELAKQLGASPTVVKQTSNRLRARKSRARKSDG